MEFLKDRHTIAAIQIGAAETPIVFTRPGTYPIDGGKQAAAFGKGSVYFRHGSKSDPATTEDLRLAFETRLRKIRKEWLSGVRKVVRAPSGSVIKILPPEVRESDEPGATPIRIVSDETAPAYRVIDWDKTHPHRLKDIEALVRQGLPSGTHFNSYDLLCIRQVYGVDKNSKFLHQSLFSSPHYSNQFANWIVEQFKKDAQFFAKARAAASSNRA